MNATADIQGTALAFFDSDSACAPFDIAEDTMTTLKIGPDLGIEAAAGLREQLLKLKRSKNPVSIAIDHIDQLHSAALQVLCSFVRDRAAAKGSTHINAPDELRTAAGLLGIGGVLGLDTQVEKFS